MLLRVFLNVTAHDLQYFSTFVELASIANEETAFTFATDSATVTLEPVTDQLILHINTALLGESSLNRISYQVVATALKIESSISGSIRWDPGLYVPDAPELSTLQTQLYPSSNTPVAGVLTALVSGHIESYEFIGGKNLAKYRIVNPPKDTPITVTVGVVSSFAHGIPARAVRVAGDEVVTLTAAQPNAQVDFEIQDMQIK